VSHFRGKRKKAGGDASCDSQAQSADSPQASVAQKVPCVAEGVPTVVPQRYEAAVAIDSLVPHPDNPNEGRDEAVVESLDANGFFGAVIAQVSTRRILVGHTRVRAAKAEGMATVPVLWVDVDDDHALRILLADNATAELAIRTPERIAAAMAKLVGDPLAGTGYRLHALAPTLPGMVTSLRVGVTAPAELAAVGDEGDGPMPDPTAPCADCGHADQYHVPGCIGDGGAECDCKAFVEQRGICAACGDGEAAEGNGVIEGDGVALWRTDDGLLCAACVEYRKNPPVDDDPDDPSPGWNGQMEPDGDDEEGGEGDGEGGDEPADDDRPAKPKSDDRYPLAIVLDKHEKRRWDEVKGMLGAGRDKVALMLCVDAVREMMGRAGEGESAADG
jgi:hypothetical protein